MYEQECISVLLFSVLSLKSSCCASDCLELVEPMVVIIPLDVLLERILVMDGREGLKN